MKRVDCIQILLAPETIQNIPTKYPSTNIPLNDTTIIIDLKLTNGIFRRKKFIILKEYQVKKNQVSNQPIVIKIDTFRRKGYTIEFFV